MGISVRRSLGKNFELPVTPACHHFGQHPLGVRCQIVYILIINFQIEVWPNSSPVIAQKPVFSLSDISHLFLRVGIKNRSLAMLWHMADQVQ